MIFDYSKFELYTRLDFFALIFCFCHNLSEILSTFEIPCLQNHKLYVHNNKNKRKSNIYEFNS